MREMLKTCTTAPDECGRETGTNSRASSFIQVWGAALCVNLNDSAWAMRFFIQIIKGHIYNNILLSLAANNQALQRVARFNFI